MLHNFYEEMRERRDDKIVYANNWASANPSGIAVDTRKGITCAICRTKTPIGVLGLILPDGTEICGDCEKLKAYCAECAIPFYPLRRTKNGGITRTNNKKTHSPECSRAYELRRARERQAAIKAASVLNTEGGY